jgi:uncharacterized short protein YbdD (DUF466 family)
MTVAGHPATLPPERDLRALWWRAVVVGRRVFLGLPDYDAYVAHLRNRHPERRVPSYREFFAERQAARYKGGGSRCC